MKKIKGAALVLALVLMLVLTSLCITLMQNTVLDNKISAAFSQQAQLSAVSFGAFNESIYKIHSQPYLRQLMSLKPMPLVVLPLTQSQLKLEPVNTTFSHCRHAKYANDAHVLCARYNMEINTQLNAMQAQSHAQISIEFMQK